MKKSIENYNNIIIAKPKLGAEATARTVETNLKMNSENNFQNIVLKKHIIFKSKVVANSAQPPLSDPLNLKRPSQVTEELNSQLSSLKKRYKLKNIDIFDRSFEKELEEKDEDNLNNNIFDLSDSLEKSDDSTGKNQTVIANQKLFKSKSCSDEHLRTKPTELNERKIFKTKSIVANDSPPPKNEQVAHKNLIKLNFDDLDDEFDLFKRKVEKEPPVVNKPEKKKFFEIKFNPHDLDDDFEVCDKKIIFKKKDESPESATKPCLLKQKIFSSKRTNEEAKAMRMFNLNPNMDDVNYEMSYQTKEGNEEFTAIAETKHRQFKVNLSDNFLEDEKNFELACSSEIVVKKRGFNKELEIEIKLRDSRKAYECEELGENQAFLDDIGYLLDGINERNKISDRCLCAIKLAENCLSPEFRMNLRVSSEYISKIFASLSDCVKYQSLALCTALIMYALTQDKLIIDIDQDTFGLLISIINMKLVKCDKPKSGGQTNKPAMTRTKSFRIFTSNSSQERGVATVDEDESDLDLFNKFSARCKRLAEKLHSMVDERCQLDMTTSAFSTNKIFTDTDSLDTSLNDDNGTDCNYDDFNPELLAMECLFTMNLNKQHQMPVDWYKNELRKSGVFDKILRTLDATFRLIKESGSASKLNTFYFAKYLRFFGFLEVVTQSTTTALASFTLVNSNENKKLKAIAAPPTNKINSSLESTFASNQNYLVNFDNNFLLILIKNSLEYFCDELSYLKHGKVQGAQRQSQFLSSIKVNLLLTINLTHKNGVVSSLIAQDQALIDLIVVCISELTEHLNKDEQFDVLIMGMSILLNILDSSVYSSTENAKAVELSAFDTILNLYKTKENQVSLAEDDQDNEFKYLAEQIESQNADNINTAIMNSIHKAGSHMEDHLIAAYSALLIGNMLLNRSDKIEQVRLEIKDNSFKYMGLIIRKFLVFMKMMNVNGFTADQSVNNIIKFLESL